MAVDKLVDSTQLDSDLTSVANAIRTKGGTSAQLAFPAEFVSAINAISGGGGDSSPIETPSYNLEWEEITIGSNTVSNVADAIAFIETAAGMNGSDYKCVGFSLISTPSTPENLIVCRAVAVYDQAYAEANVGAYRYKNGSLAVAQNTNQYDGVIPEGSKYLVSGYNWKGASLPNV